MDNIKTNAIFDKLIDSISISKTNFENARKRYRAVATWVTDKLKEQGYSNINVYPQGSFALGTIITPCAENPNYDVDMVCSMDNPSEKSPKEILDLVGDAIKSNETYLKMLEQKTGVSRCWTLQYSEEGSGFKFHMDILPAEYLQNNEKEINIVDLNNDDYVWLKSNPSGFIEWFNRQQLRKYFEPRALSEAVDIESLKNQNEKTPLQKVIMILKNHRDKYFSKDRSFAPSSIMITTLAAAIYNGENDATDALLNISKIIAAYASLNENVSDYSRRMEGLIYKDIATNTWRLDNPSLSSENFIDSWNKEDDRHMENFIDWAKKARTDIYLISKGRGLTEIINESFNLRTTLFEDVTVDSIFSRPVSVRTQETKPWGV